MTELAHGDVILYSYLWAREHERGQESGCKPRPTCVMMIIAGRDGRNRPLLFPITSQPPQRSARFVEVPETKPSAPIFASGLVHRGRIQHRRSRHVIVDP